MASIVPDVRCIRKDGVVRVVLWAYSSKRGEFHRSAVTVKVSRVRVRFSDRVGKGLSDLQ